MTMVLRTEKMFRTVLDSLEITSREVFVSKIEMSPQKFAVSCLLFERHFGLNDQILWLRFRHVGNFTPASLQSHFTYSRLIGPKWKQNFLFSTSICPTKPKKMQKSTPSICSG
jgi:hypothetical protein